MAAPASFSPTTKNPVGQLCSVCHETFEPGPIVTVGGGLYSKLLKLIGWQVSEGDGIRIELFPDGNPVDHGGEGRKHPLHRYCVEPWLAEHSSCPVCRIPCELVASLHRTFLINAASAAASLGALASLAAGEDFRVLPEEVGLVGAGVLITAGGAIAGQVIARRLVPLNYAAIRRGMTAGAVAAGAATIAGISLPTIAVAGSVVAGLTAGSLAVHQRLRGG